MLSCKDVTRLASDAMDRELPLWQRMQMRLHLMMCKHCARYVDQLQRVRLLAKEYDERVGEEEDDVRLDEAARARLVSTIEAQIEDENT